MPLQLQRTLCVAVLLAICLSPALADEPDVIRLGSRRELFVDRELTDKLEGARLVLHRPRREGPALQFADRPWEGMYSGYVTVLKDGPEYRMYYRGIAKYDSDNSTQEVTCVAQSQDGITWTRPKLGLYEINGTKDNNVVLAGMPPYSHNFSPWIDTRPGVPADERYKSLSGSSTRLGGAGLGLFVSGDGLRWRLKKAGVIAYEGPGHAFDSQACAFWSESERCYVCYFRVYENRLRLISRATSQDCLEWTAKVDMQYGDTPPEEFYTNMTNSYYRAPHIYIALSQRFFRTRTALPPRQVAKLIPDRRSRGWCSDVALLSTRGGAQYDRTFMESFIRPGPSARDWASRNNTAAWGIVPARDDARWMYIYRQSHPAQPTSHVTRYSLRVDGFASVSAPFAGGELLTKPLTFKGKRLELNYETSAAGSLQVEIQDADGQPIPGFTLADSTKMLGDQIARTYAWKSGTDVSSLAGKAIRLRFVMKDADMYSFRFVE